MQSKLFVPGFALALTLSQPAGAQTPPAQHLGYAVGADFHLPDWNAVSGWYKELDSKSARVSLEIAGETTEGREYLACVIAGEANMAKLDAIRSDARLLADPRQIASPQAADELIARAVPIVVISNAMHSTEVAAPQFAMELAWNLATSQAEPWKSVREKVVVVILPCTNPDGLDKVSHWYMDSVGKSFNECTAQSILFLASATSSSRVNNPLAPISVSG